MTQYPQYPQYHQPPYQPADPGYSNLPPQDQESLGSWVLVTFIMFIPLVNLIHVGTGFAAPQSPSAISLVPV